MTIFEIIVSIGFLGVFIGLGLIIWSAKKIISKPAKELKEFKQKAIEIEVEQAKVTLDNSIKAETRLEAQVNVVKKDDSLDKLRQLRRKK